MNPALREVVVPGRWLDQGGGFNEYSGYKLASTTELSNQPHASQPYELLLQKKERKKV